MKCPSCGSEDIKVVDSRPVDENNSIRRRRECLTCHNRFTTYEVIDAFQPVVVKKDGTKELFDKNKLLSGLLRACQKRPVNAEEIASSVEQDLQNSIVTEISSKDIGEMVLARLRDVDIVSYIRFASVYREFRDIDSFMEEIKSLSKSKKKSTGKRTGGQND